MTESERAVEEEIRKEFGHSFGEIAERRHLDGFSKLVPPPEPTRPLYSAEVIASLVDNLATADRAMHRAKRIARSVDMGESVVSEFERVQDRIEQARNVLRERTEVRE